MSQNIKAIVWDMGGVILRSEDQEPRSILAEKVHLSKDDLYNLVFGSESAQLATVGKIPEEEHWKIVGKTLKLSNVELADFQRLFWAGDRVDLELLEFIRELNQGYITGLLSNAWSRARRVLTEVYHCINAFQFSMFSSELGLAKPDPAIYHKMLEVAGVNAEQTIFVDDMPANIEAANLLGIHGVLFKDSQQTRQDVFALLRG